MVGGGGDNAHTCHYNLYVLSLRTFCAPATGQAPAQFPNLHFDASGVVRIECCACVDLGIQEKPVMRGW